MRGESTAGCTDVASSAASLALNCQRKLLLTGLDEVLGPTSETPLDMSGGSRRRHSAKHPSLQQP